MIDEYENETLAVTIGLRVTERHAAMIRELAEADDRSDAYITRVLFIPALERAYAEHRRQVTAAGQSVAGSPAAAAGRTVCERRAA